MEKIKIKQVRSRIGRPKDQKLTLDALGLTKMNKVVEHNATPQILGMVKKIQHLIKVLENKKHGITQFKTCRRFHKKGKKNR